MVEFIPNDFATHPYEVIDKAKFARQYWLLMKRTTSASVKKLEDWLHKQPEAAIVTSYTGGGAPRFFLAYNPELPNPNFAKLVISTPSRWRMRGF